MRVSVSRPDGWLAAKLPVRLTTAICGACAESARWRVPASSDARGSAGVDVVGDARLQVDARHRQPAAETPGRRSCAARDGMGGVRGRIEIEQPPRTPGPARRGRRAREASGPGPGASRRRRWRPCRVAFSAGATSGALVGAESTPASRRSWARWRRCHSTPRHGQRGQHQDGEDHDLVAGNHGWRPPAEDPSGRAA